MSQEPFGDIPLFRELQKLLESSEGPVNLTIAGQVAQAISGQEMGGPSGTTELLRSYGGTLRDAELLLSGYTRLQIEEPARPALMTRSEWITSTLTGYRWLLDHFASRMSGSFESAGEVAGSQQALIGHVVPLLMGLQTGTLIGHLSLEALGRYDLPIPRDDDARLFLVYPNASEVATSYGFESESFMRWMALREMAHHLIIRGHSWVARYQRSALTELVDSIEIDATDIERRLMDLQSQGVEALQGMRTDNALPVVPTQRHEAALARLQAFLSVLEGYAAHAGNEVGTQIVEEHAKIAEGMARRDASPSDGKTALTGLLGLSTDRSLRSAGITFCAAVVKLKGIETLNKLWEAPDNLPTLDEVRDPFQWIERVVEEQ